MTDLELLKQYREARSQEAFAELVRRHIEWVYGAAKRLVHDRELAEDVAQGVFLALSQKAKSLQREQALSPWLLRVTRCAAISAMRAVSRRQHHEQKAAAMRRESTTADSEAQWEEVAPLLDEQVLRLGKKDQEAILLRFYERKGLAAVGKAMGLSEEAAKKRVQRAVEKLRGMLGKKGVRGTTAGLSAVLVGNVVGETPALLVEGIMKAVGSGGGNSVAAGIAKGAMKMMTVAKVKLVVVAVVVAASVFAAAAQVITHSGDEAPTTVPTRTGHGETVRDAKVAADATATRILQDMIAKRAARPPVAMDLDVRMRDNMGQQWGQKERIQHAKVGLRQDGRRMDALFMPADDAEGREFGLNGRAMWDGSRYMAIDTRPAEPAREPDCVLSNRSDGLELIIHRPWVAAFADAVLGEDPAPVPEMMLQSQTAKVVSQRDPIGGVDCILLEATGKTGTYRMWVEPKSLMPQRIVYERRPTDENPYSFLDEVTDMRAEEVGGHMIVTKASRLVTAFKDGKIVGTYVSHVTRSNIIWNPDFAAMGAFVMDFPKGAIIEDIDQRSISYEWVDGKPIVRSDADLRQETLPAGDSLPDAPASLLLPFRPSILH